MPEKLIKAPCASCKGHTNHEILHREDVRFSSEDISGADEFRIIRCCGCDTVSFQQMHWDTDYLEVDGTPIEQFEHYPFPEGGREPIAGYNISVPRRVRKIYLEAIQARNHDLLILAGIGVRAVVEAICLDKDCKVGDLKNSIEALQRKGIVTKEQADYLHLNRFVGNVAAHTLNEATLKEIDTALNIIDHILTLTYKLPDQANRLKVYERPKAQPAAPNTGSTSV